MIFRPNDLSFEPSLCLRAASSVNRCEDCVQICTLNALSINRDRVELDSDKCISCGACVGVCKPDAFLLKSFNIPTFIVWATKQKENLKIACDEIGVCLSVFKSDYLASLALRCDGEVSLDMTKCEHCEYNHHGKLSCQILSNVFDANSTIHSLDKMIKANIAQVSDRRDFLKKLHDTKIVWQEFNSPIKQPASRMLALSIKDPTDDFAKKIKKIVLDKCNACNDCTLFCPTSSLESANDGKAILHRPSECIACGICSSVCEQNAIKTEDVTLRDFIRSHVLISFEIKECIKCGTLFTTATKDEKCDGCGKFLDAFPDMFKTASELE